MNEISKKLADKHWNYIEDLLETHGEREDLIEKLAFHYRKAFIHGFNHGVNWLKEQEKETTRKSFP